MVGSRHGRVAVVGGYGTAVIFGVGRSPGQGETVLATSLHFDHGGKGSNQAVAASRMGARVALLSAVGNDSFGENGRRLWDVEGIDASCVITAGQPTMVGAILVEQSGDNRIVVGMGALGQLGPADVDHFAGHIGTADVCVVSLEVPTEVAAHALRTAGGKNVLTVLNPAPATPLPEDVVRAADVLVPNRSEAAAMTANPADRDPNVLVDDLRAQAQGCIVLTLGPAGALVDDGALRRHVPAAPGPKVVDTTGAGDAFIGALAASLAMGLDIFAAAEVGSAAAGISVGTASVVPSLPYLRDLPLSLQESLAELGRDEAR